MTNMTNDELVRHLTDQLSVVYREAQRNDDQAMQQLCLKNATALNNDVPYLDAITTLTHDISKYYVHYHQVPATVMAIYRELQNDVKAGKIDAHDGRYRNLAAGLVMSPVMFGGR